MSVDQLAEQGGAQEMWFTQHFLEVCNNMGLKHGGYLCWLCRDSRGSVQVQSL